MNISYNPYFLSKIIKMIFASQYVFFLQLQIPSSTLFFVVPFFFSSLFLVIIIKKMTKTKQIQLSKWFIHPIKEENTKENTSHETF